MLDVVGGDAQRFVIDTSAALSALLFLYGKVREVKRLPVTLSLDYRSCSGMLIRHHVNNLNFTRG